MSASKKVLVADDDENERFLMQWAFNKAGFNELIVFAKDGQETIEILKNKALAEIEIHTHLLLLDIRMPRVDGFEVLKWLQGNSDFRPARVMMLSSSSDPKDIQNAMLLGADGYLVKPHGLAAHMKMIQDFELHMIFTNNAGRRDLNSD